MEKHKWVKRLIIFLVVAVLIIFFGAVAFNLTAYVFDALKIFCGWIAIALRWLGKVFNFFGYAGIFTASADASTVAHGLQTAAQILRIGG